MFLAPDPVAVFKAESILREPGKLTCYTCASADPANLADENGHYARIRGAVTRYASQFLSSSTTAPPRPTRPMLPSGWRRAPLDIHDCSWKRLQPPTDPGHADVAECARWREWDAQNLDREILDEDESLRSARRVTLDLGDRVLAMRIKSGHGDCVRGYAVIRARVPAIRAPSIHVRLSGLGKTAARELLRAVLR